MANNNSSNLDVNINADGFDVAGGTTKRKLTITGGDATIDASGANTYTLPAASDTLVGRLSTDTLTNKTIDADGTGNVITNIGSSEIKAEIVTGLTEEATPAAGDFLLGVETGGALRKFDIDNLPSGGGSGDVTKVGTPVDNQVGVWTGDGTLEGGTGLTYNSGSETLSVGGSGANLALGGGIFIGNASGTFTLRNIDLLDATTETTIESAIDSLPNLASIGQELDMGANSIGFTMQTATGDGTTTVDWGNGNHFDFTFGAFNETFTFTAPAKPGVYTMSLTQDSTGSRTATWPATVRWAGGSAPTLTTTATTGYDVISFRFDGTNYYGVASLDFS